MAHRYKSPQSRLFEYPETSNGFGVGLCFELRKAFDRGAVGHFIEVGDPAEDLAATVLRGAKHLHALVGIIGAANGELHRIGAAQKTS